jgi:hypothetical protein
MAEVFKYGLMDQDTMDFGEMEWLTDLVDWSMLKVMCMRENGLKIRLMAMGFILTSMAADMRANGSKINNMDLELSNGLMEQNMRDSMNME